MLGIKWLLNDGVKLDQPLLHTLNLRLPLFVLHVCDEARFEQVLALPDSLLLQVAKQLAADDSAHLEACHKLVICRLDDVLTFGRRASLLHRLNLKIYLFRLVGPIFHEALEYHVEIERVNHIVTQLCGLPR